MIEVINDKALMKEFLENNPVAFKEGLLRIYSFQTSEEKLGEHTGELNGLGFNRYDSEFLTEVAIEIMNDIEIDNAKLELARKRMVKYAGQLVRTN